MEGQNHQSHEYNQFENCVSEATQEREEKPSNVHNGFKNYDNIPNYCAVDNEPDIIIHKIHEENSPPSREEPRFALRVWLTISPILVCYVCTFIALVPICTQYFTARIAEESYNISINSTSDKSKCSNSTQDDEDLINDIQKEASTTILYATIASSIPGLFLTLIIGSYSDYVGRKPLIIAALLGGMIRIVFLCVIIKANLDIQFYYVGSFVDGLLGSYFSITLSTTAIIADITPNPRNRALRFALIEGCLFTSGALSQLAIGYMISAWGFFVPTAICASLLFLSLVLAIFALPETMQIKRKVKWNPVSHLRKVFGFYFFDGNALRRAQYATGLAIFLTINLTNLGRLSVETLFVMNAPVCWDSVDIGIFNAVRLVAMSIIAIITLKSLKHRLSLEVTGILCGASAIAGFIMEGFADSTLTMYLSALVGIFYIAVIPLPRALLSQITAPTEQGALFSSMSSIETVASMVSATTYTLIYNSTVDSFKGAVFMCMASLSGVSCILFGIFWLLRRWQPVAFEIEIIPDDVQGPTHLPTANGGTNEERKPLLST